MFFTSCPQTNWLIFHNLKQFQTWMSDVIYNFTWQILVSLKPRPTFHPSKKIKIILHQQITYKILLILSTAAANFCSSSGQISGQWVKPKYNKVHFPMKSFSVTCFPWWLITLNGPPIAAFPVEGPCLTASVLVRIPAAIKVESIDGRRKHHSTSESNWNASGNRTIWSDLFSCHP